VTNRPTDLVSLWSVEVSDASDSAAMTRIFELPSKLDTSLIPADPSLDEAYHRFVAAADAFNVVHNEFDAMFAALRELQSTQTEQSTTASLERINATWRRLDAATLHLTAVVPRGRDVVSSVTVDLYQFLRGLLTRSARFRSGPSGQFRVELDALADRLARYDHNASTQAGDQR
jgi:hypothetical protein